MELHDLTQAADMKRLFSGEALAEEPLSAGIAGLRHLDMCPVGGMDRLLWKAWTNCPLCRPRPLGSHGSRIPDRTAAIILRSPRSPMGCWNVSAICEPGMDKPGHDALKIPLNASIGEARVLSLGRLN